MADGPHPWRIADANLNRAREGLRLLEEVARFLLDDAPLSERLKALRHELGPHDEELEGRLLAARRAEEDVAAFLNPPSEMERASLPALVRANARRVEESLRVLEEFAKLPRGLEAATFKRIRFVVYEMERVLVSRLQREEKVSRLKGLYVIIDQEFCRGRGALEVAEAALRGGARILQLRDKSRPKGELLVLARRLQELCRQADALFIVNDHPDLALAAGADGVHVGQKDLPVAVVREIVGLDMLVGCSANNAEEARRAQAEGADYVGVGSIFPSGTKADARPAGLATIRLVKGAVSLPVVAIGGIDADKVAQVMAAGADAAAVISAVVGAPDVEAAARLMVSRMRAAQKMEPAGG